MCGCNKNTGYVCKNCRDKFTRGIQIAAEVKAHLVPACEGRLSPTVYIARIRLGID